ncbi:GntR family transcriptional regulator [Enterococcus devriesei]|nr:GntR family transcriptional regulator [Enterococcus devriesei]MBU5364410.1 GntR family transcriptional regulator [Enterococcus devriesei]MDT2820135.1 GntR family transcriptional regulator [Enterococcus devriesei]
MAGAKFYPIYMKLKERIKNGEYEEMLPTESVLTQEFNTSRNTIRRAILMLKEEGLVYSVKGRGVLILETIADDRWDFDAGGFNGLEAIEQANQMETETKVLCLKKIIIDEKLQGKVPFTTGEILYQVERLRILNGDPLMLDISYFRFDQVPILTKSIAEKSIYQYLKDQDVHIAAAKRRFLVTKADEKDMEYLDLGTNNCVGVMENLVFNDMGRLFEYTQSRFVPDRFSLTYFAQNADL